MRSLSCIIFLSLVVSSLAANCWPGYYELWWVCYPCPAGTGSAGGYVPFSCPKCEFGKYGPGASPCLPCPVGTQGTRQGLASCDPCPVGNYAATTGNAWCTACPVGYSANGGASSCFPCPAGTGSRADYPKGGCMECEQATYSTGGTGCIPCPPGTYMTYSMNNGKGGNSLASCVAAPAGTYVRNSKSIAFTPCPPGTYNPNTGSTTLAACIPCPSATPYTIGESPTGVGATSASQCIATCPATAPRKYISDGKFGCYSSSCPTGTVYTDATTCTQCPAGNYWLLSYSYTVIQTLAQKCIPCPSGGTSPAGSRDCDFQTYVCPAGTYRSGSACLPCALGWYSTGGGPNAVCTACPAGQYGVVDRDGCLPCPANTFSNDVGSASCTRCAAGTFSFGSATSCKSLAGRMKVKNQNFAIGILNQVIANDGKAVIYTLYAGQNEFIYTAEGFLKLKSNPTLGLTVQYQNVNNDTPIILHQWMNKWTITKEGFIVLQGTNFGLTVLYQSFSNNNQIILHQGMNQWEFV